MTDTRYRSNVNLDDIEPSPTNPRKHFDEGALAELAANIKAHGVITPILLRTSSELRPKPYEIISGERRWRASILAEQRSIPAIIRDDLTDAQVIELQIIENLQRQDLHPIEEAEGYGLMMREHGYTADSLAEKIAKSRSYIFGRLKLLDLNEEGRRLFRGGLLNPSVALLIARIPTHSLQTKAIIDVTQKDYRGDVMSFRAAQAHIQNRYMTKLDSAPFPTEAPDLIATAGACSQCPKRTGNMPDIFDDIESGNVCTDPDCFSAKRMAQAERRLQAAGPGVKVISGEEAAKVMPSYACESRTHVKLDQVCYDDPERRTYRQIMGNDQDGIALVEHRDKTDLVEVVEKKVVVAKLRNAGIELEKDKQRAEQKKLNAKVSIENAWRDRLYRQIRDKVANQSIMDLMQHAMPIIAHRFMIEVSAERGGQVAGLWGALGSDNHTRCQAFMLALPTMTPADLLRVCLDLALIAEHKTDQYNLTRKPECMLTCASALSIDANALLQCVKDEEKAAESAKKGKKQPKKPNPTASGEAPSPLKAAQAGDLLRAETAETTADAIEAARAGGENADGCNEESPATAGEEGNEKPNGKQRTFAVGDRVRIIAANDQDLVELVGKTGVVSAIGNSFMSGIQVFSVRMDDVPEDALDVAAYADEIEMYEEPTAAEPTEGETTQDAAHKGAEFEMDATPSAQADAESAEPAQLATKVTVKYRHPENSELAWSGRGRQPKWVEHWLSTTGRPLEDLSVDAQGTPKSKASIEIGDTVKVAYSTNASLIGKEGKVESYFLNAASGSDTSDVVRVKIKGIGLLTFKTENLQKVELPAGAEA